MKLNATTALLSPEILLVPYESHHVPTYHSWMEDEELREATASERLTLEEEYEMQKKWRLDVDKLTFITCLPPSRVVPSDGCVLPTLDDATDRMLGDVNLFLYEDDSGGDEKRMIGEVELMIARKEHQGKGLGRASLLLFLHYVLKHGEEIVKERLGSDIPNGARPPTLSALRVKINQANVPSMKLFESIGFAKKSDQPNYFGEYDLVLQELDLASTKSLMGWPGIEGMREVSYENAPYVALRSISSFF